VKQQLRNKLLRVGQLLQRALLLQYPRNLLLWLPQPRHPLVAEVEMSILGETLLPPLL
jgi:hypothetical protein